jgi:hypothetical protein
MTRTAPGWQEGEASSRPSPTSRTRRPSSYKKRPTNLDCYTCDMALNIVARKVEIAKANNGGVVPYAAMTDIVKSMKPTLPWLTKGMLRNYINKLNKEKIKKDAARPSADEDVDATANNGSESSSTSTLSALTFDTTGGNSNTAGATGTTMGATSEEDNTTGGRPKGSNGKSKRDVKQRQQLALLEATKQYQGALRKTRQENGATTRLMHGTLATIIENA